MFILRLIQKYKVIKRFNKILLVFFKTGFSFFIFKIGFHKHINPLKRLVPIQELPEQELPKKLREAFVELGPVFVKFGQILSTRSDILPQAYIMELEKLQADVPPFNYPEAKAIIEKNFQKPLNEIFPEFSAEPFASASLGQVYRARLKDGQAVAVKVQRPKAKEQIKLDTQVLLMIAHLIDKHWPEAKGYNIIEVVQEFRRWTLNELDYRKEATNCEIFNNFFKNDKNIYGPKVFWEFSGENVLTLEFVDGYSLSDLIKGEKTAIANKKQVVHMIADSFIRQFFEYGFFHADPHPGNIFIVKNKHVLFLDFGMVGFLDNRLTGLGAGMFLALIQKDIDALVSLLLQIEADYGENTNQQDIRSVVKVNSLRKELTELVLQWSSMGQAGRFTQLLSEILQSAIRNGINLPTDFTMLSKSIVTLDVVAKQLDPNFAIEKWEQPMVEKILERKFKPSKIKSQVQSAGMILEQLIKKLPESTATIVDNLEKGKFGMEINRDQLLEYEKLLNANSKFTSYGTPLAAIIIASALIFQVKGQPEILGLSIAQIGLYGGLALIMLFFISNINKPR